jgi:hypothetical protein
MLYALSSRESSFEGVVFECQPRLYVQKVTMLSNAIAGVEAFQGRQDAQIDTRS